MIPLGCFASRACQGTPTVVSGGSALNYAMGGTVTNTGVGTLYNVTVEDTLPNGTKTSIPVASSLNAKTTVNWALPGGFTTNANTPNPQSVTNTAFAKGFTDSGLTNLVTGPTPPTAVTCSASVSDAIGISKNCGIGSLPGTTLVLSGGKVVVQFNVCGQVCNNGQAQLTGIALGDVPNVSISYSGSTLAPGACAPWTATYQASSITSADPNGLIASRYFFADTINVTAATPALGTLSPPKDANGNFMCPNGSGGGYFACAAQSCPICPSGLCAP